jgi:hypothetical protein
MKTLDTSIRIDAPAGTVWKILTDFPSYPQWNPFIRKLDGEARAGARLRVLLQPSGMKGTTFRPRVLAASTEREFRWRGRLLIPGLFDGEHIFLIEPLAEGRVRFVQRENFSGILAPVIMRMIERDTRRGFQEMNEALKERAEGRR